MGLSLSRSPGESIYIGDKIIVTVQKVKGNKATLNIEAPADVSIHRHEVHEAIQREKQEENDAR